MMAFVLYLIVKNVNRFKAKEVVVAAAPAGPTQEDLLAEIRDLLKKK
jgi:large conductance mechanosensitive channel